MNAELQELLLSVRAGDQGAFSRLYEQYLPLIEHLAAQYAQSLASSEDEDTDDFRQEAALTLYQAALAYRLEQTSVEFGLFAKICIKNRLIDRLRTLHRRALPIGAARSQESGERENLEELVDDAAVDPEERLVDAEALDALNALIERNLSRYEQRILKLYLSGYSVREIAGTVKRGERSVENAVYRIRRKLKTLLRMPG